MDGDNEPMTTRDMAGPPDGDDVAAEAPYTNFQWYLAAARNAVFFAGYSPKRLTPDEFTEMVTHVMRLAPQLYLRHDDQRQAHVDARPFDLADIITYREVADFEGLPDRAVATCDDIFDDPRLPDFRAECYALRDGATADGNRCLIVFRSSHALMEGIDTANVLRGRRSTHAPPEARNRRPVRHFISRVTGALVFPIDHLIAAVHWRDMGERGLRTMALSRADLKRAAAELGIQQRTLIFALITWGIGHARGQLWRPLVIGYTNLTARRFDGDDSFVRLRMQNATIRGHREFAVFARRLDARLARDGRERLRIQMHFNAIFGVHRRMIRVLPALYRRRFFGFAPYDYLLSLLPPHAPGGTFADLKLNAVYCGAFQNGTNCAVIVPQPDRVTFAFYGPTRVLARTSGIEELAATLGISTIAPPGAASAAITASSASEA